MFATAIRAAYQQRGELRRLGRSLRTGQHHRSTKSLWFEARIRAESRPGAEARVHPDEQHATET
jgi:hypothetical protein